MHDLDTINRLNREQFLDAAEKARKSGKHVVVTYDGLNVTGYETFAFETEAVAKFKYLQQTAGASERFTMLLPSGTNIEADRGETELDQDQPELTSEEEGRLIEAANKRDRTLQQLQLAAFEYAFAQQSCTDLAVELRKKMEERHAASSQQPLPFND